MVKGIKTLRRDRRRDRDVENGKKDRMDSIRKVGLYGGAERWKEKKNFMKR